MRLLWFSSGWSEAPHCWKTYLAKPVRIDRTPAFLSVTVLGFTAFFGR